MKFFVSISSVIVVIIAWWALELKQSLPEISTTKINGVSLVNPHFEADSSHFKSLQKVNAQWVAIIPYAFSRQNDPQVYFNNDKQWWGEREEGCEKLIQLAHISGLKVMIKPHVWMHGSWIGDFDLKSEEDWLTWEKAYQKYILTFARQAEALNVEMFCIGTELKIATTKRPEFWVSLIQQIREVYSGKVTYAANWDNYQNISFWDQLDMIGIDAYFPILQQKSATTNELITAWTPVKGKLRAFSEKVSKPILFTEYGYQSVNGATGNHWEVAMKPDQKNETLQANAYEALYKTFWQEPWMAGGFLWKWHLGDHKGRNAELSFTPQDKAAEKVVFRWYSQKQSLLR